MQHHYVYKITCTHPKHKDQYYYGKRTCKCEIQDDPYMGSGKIIQALQNKYGMEYFIKNIIVETVTAKEAYDMERSIVTPDLIEDPMCLNLVEGGKGGMPCVEVKQQTSRTMKAYWEHNTSKRDEYSKMLRNRDPEINKKISRGLTGKPKSAAHNKAVSVALTGKVKSDEHKQKISETLSGRPQSEEALRKRAETNKNPDVIAKRRASQANRPYVICPHCGRSIAKCVAKRWHFDNCKQKGA